MGTPRYAIILSDIRHCLMVLIVKLDDGAQHKNLRIWSVSTGQELVSFTQKSQEGWDLQYTISESHAIRLVGPEIQVFKPAEWAKGVVDKLKVEGATSVTLSPGLNPSIAVFIAEKKVSNIVVVFVIVPVNVELGPTREHQDL
jgi:translation initiation factor 2A